MRTPWALAALTLTLLALPTAVHATVGVPLDTGNIDHANAFPQHSYYYGNYGSQWPGCVNTGFQQGQFAPDTAPPTLPGPCGNYTQTNTTLEAHFRLIQTAGRLAVSIDVENPSRTGRAYLTVNGIAQPSTPIADNPTPTWVALPAATVAAGDDVAVIVKTDYLNQTGRFTVHTAHGTLGDPPIVYGKAGAFSRTPIPANVAVAPTDTTSLQAALTQEVTSTNKAAVNSGAWTQPVYRYTPATPRVSVWLWRSSFGTGQPSYIKPRQAQLNVGDPSAMTGIPDPAVYGWAPRPSPDSDQEFAAFCAACASPDAARTGYSVELWKFRTCTATDLTYAPLDPATGQPYVYCAGEGGRDTGTDQSAGHPVTDYQGYTYPATPDPFTDPLHAAKFEDKGDEATATSLPNAVGEITEADVQQGHADHPIGFAMIYPWPGYVWPAQRGDGFAASPHPVVREGERFFLPASTDCSALPHPLEATIICPALKTYGGFIDDKAGAWSMRVEPAVAADPIWASVGGSSQLDGVPWNTVQVIGKDPGAGGPVDYGSDSEPFPTTP